MDVLSRLKQAIGGVGNEERQTNSDNDKGSRDAGSKQSASTFTLSSQDPLKNPFKKQKENVQTRAKQFRDNWLAIRSTLLTPHQAALHHGLSRTDLVDRLQSMCDALVFEANRADEDVDIAGPCMEMLLEGDILGQLVRLTANDRISGSQAEVVQLFASLIILLDERFLSRQAVHRPLVRLMRICVGDEFFQAKQNTSTGTELDQSIIGINEDEEKRAHRKFGRIGSAETLGFEERLVDLMCHIASRLRNTPDLLIIFFRERGGDEEARKAFNLAMSSSPAPPSSRLSTRAPSPAQNQRNSPIIPSPLRPQDLESFTDAGRGTSSPASSASGALSYDFPLFSYLLRFVHRESRTGELARAGILFLVDVAFAPGRRNLARSTNTKTVKNASIGRSFGSPYSKSPRTGPRRSGTSTPQKHRIEADLGLGPNIALARFMVESDFSEVLGAGIGAVYGLLPTKLSLSKFSDENDKGDLQERRDAMLVGQGESMALGEGEKVHLGQNDASFQSVFTTGSEEVRQQARILCDLLEFTQDILRTAVKVSVDFSVNKSTESADLAKPRPAGSVELSLLADQLTQSISASLQSLFLENILYPSMLECSDVDSSSTAVMTYLEAMLSVLETDNALSDCIVGWLTGSEASDSDSKNDAHHFGLRAKRKSTAMIQLEKEQSSMKFRQNSSYQTDAFGRYTIRDLLVDNLQLSTQQSAVLSALRLATTLITFHGKSSLSTVIQIKDDPLATAFPTNLVEIMKEEEDSIKNSKELQSFDSDDSDESDEFVYPGTEKDDEKFLNRLHSMARQTVGGYKMQTYSREIIALLSLMRRLQVGDARGTRSSFDSSIDQTYSSTGFDNYLEDAATALMRDSMGRSALRLWEEVSIIEAGDSTHERSRRLGSCRRHKLQATDRFLRTLLVSLCSYWRNRPEVNVATTGLLSAICSCPIRSLEGFLCHGRQSSEMLLAIKSNDEEQGNSDTNENGEEEDDLSEDERTFMIQSTLSFGQDKHGKVLNHDLSKVPVLLNILTALVDQLQRWRRTIAHFDRYLDERRRGLLFVENLNEALKLSGVDELEKSNENTETERESTPFDVYSKQISSKRKDDIQKGHIQPVKPLKNAEDVISLPPPPSATPTQESFHQTDSSDRDKKATVERGNFARFFGRAANALSTADKGQKDAVSQANTHQTHQPPPKPFAQHFLQTASLIVDVSDSVYLVDSSPWSIHFDPEKQEESQEKNTGKKIKRTRFQNAALSDTESEVTFTYPGSEKNGKHDQDHIKEQDSVKVSLSTILDNAIILEETVKELIAILQVRRAYGVDATQIV